MSSSESSALQETQVSSEQPSVPEARDLPEPQGSPGETSAEAQRPEEVANWEPLGEEPQDESINFDSDPLLEVTLSGVEYRLDVGMQGTALSVSARGEGQWDWRALGEAKWDGVSLRCKELPRQLREQLARALKSLGED